MDTQDISTTGLTLIVPAVRIGARYLTDQDLTLHLKLQLPKGTIQIQAIPKRYESLDDKKGFLIGAQIIGVNATDRALLVEYLKSLR